MNSHVNRKVFQMKELNEEIFRDRKAALMMEEVIESFVIKLVQGILCADETEALHFLSRSGQSGSRIKPLKGSPLSSPFKLRNMAQSVYLLNTVHKLVFANRQVNQRELFYRSLSDPYTPCFTDQNSMNRALSTLLDALDCDRHELGIFTTARGLVTANPGSETICLDSTGDFICDLADHADGLSISDQLVEIRAIQTEASCVLIVEKDTVFQSLASCCDFFGRVNCILVTARGYPDNITVRFLKVLRRILPLRFLYLGDLDPHGVSIAMIYHKALEGEMEWIGLHNEDVEALEHGRVLGMKLKSSDLSLINTLLEKPCVPEYVKKQLAGMEARGLKYEVECLHSVSESYLATEWLPRKISNSKRPVDEGEMGSTEESQDMNSN